MKQAIVLGVSMIVTILSLGFIAPESGCQEASCIAPLCLTQVSDRGQGIDRRLGNDHPKGRGPRDGRLMMDEMPQHMVERVMEIAKEIDPELADRLSCMCRDDPEAFSRLIRRQGRRLGSLVELRDSDPDLFEVKVNELKLDAEIFKTTKSIRKLGVEEEVSQAQIATLRGLVRAKTALNIRKQTLYIERLERHLEGLREKLADTSARFDEVVEEQVEHLLQSPNPAITDKLPPR
ncbi:MAG: hypothetical protein QGF07_04130 [Phycisphaerales bacterium]|jgi:hypothetical protein|nr:hypothetical protein [Phycisphaerales bacterium]